MTMKFDVCIASKSPLLSSFSQISLDTLKDICCCVHLSDRVPISKAREELISNVDTEWFLFLDDDVIITPSWTNVLLAHINESRIGAIEGWIPDCGFGKWVDEVLEKYVQAQSIWILADGQRGFTHNTLIKTSLVKDWKPEREMNCYEDYSLTRHIQGKGYSWVRIPAIGKHMKSWRKLVRNGIWGGRNFEGSKLKEIFRIVKWLVKSPFNNYPLPIKIYDMVQQVSYIGGLIVAMVDQNRGHRRPVTVAVPRTQYA